MATYTPNFNLCKPEGTDDFDNFLSEFGDNMDIIDANLGGGGGSGGHTIIDQSGTSMPQRTGLQFIGATVTDDQVNDKTVVNIAGGGGGVHYSTTEQVIGTWFNKPLYQISFVLPSPVNISQSSWDSMGVTVADGENVIFCWGVATDGTGSPLMGYFDSNTLKCQTPRNNVPSYSIQYLTIQYTKTTD